MCLPLRVLSVLTLLPLFALAQQTREHFDLDAVTKEAAALIKQPYARETYKLPNALEELDYDDYRKIRFRPSEALWWNDPARFRVEFFHLGHIFKDPVQIFETSETHVQEVPFLKNAFDYGQSDYQPGFLKGPGGYAGIRVKYPLNREDVYDDLIVFQGASYFRALGKDQAYGLSLRGLLMNTLGDREDFPRFTKLWLRKPTDKSKSLYIYALLEGEKVTGAYEFVIKPSGNTVIDVHARLFFREGGMDEVGIAPITSMFVFGENSPHKFNDWRPEVHDSDGVLIHSDLTWTWHPLENLPGRYSKTFPVAKLEGFGLMQRDRDFANYKDLEAHYEKRPSAWITPKGKWPTGSVMLYTFGTDNEATDNVTLFWKPDLKENNTGPLDLRYSISLRTKEPTHPLAKVLETRIGQRTLDASAQTIMIEFSRPETIAEEEIAQLSLGFEAAALDLINDPVIQYNAVEDRIRATINVRLKASERRPIELSAQLLREGNQISEKWSYSW